MNKTGTSALASDEYEVVVIGGGAAGLAAAWRLREAGVDAVVVEREECAGGRARTEAVDGFRIDPGAGFYATFYENTLGLARALGLGAEISKIPSNVAIVRHGRPQLLNPNLRPYDTPLFSLGSKLRLFKALFPVLTHWRQLDFHAFEAAVSQDTQSVTDYALSSLNRELLDYALEPALSGIFYWSPERTSQAMLFILLKAGLMGLSRFTFRQGVGELMAAMAARLPVEPGTEAQEVTADGAGYCVRLRTGGEEREVRARGVVCATTADRVPELFPELGARQRDFFTAISYSQTVVAAVALDRRPFPQYANILVPRKEEQARRLAAVASLAAKNPEQVRPGGDVVELYASGRAAGQLIDLSDGDIRNALVADLPGIGLENAGFERELFHRVYRWRHALPEFNVGHFERLRSFAAGEIEDGRIVFAGDYLGGPYIEGAVTSGSAAAGRLLALLR
jgi:oxygen-dependent protoporphyrinogen oxidase